MTRQFTLRTLLGVITGLAIFFAVASQWPAVAALVVLVAWSFTGMTLVTDPFASETSKRVGYTMLGMIVLCGGVLFLPFILYLLP